MRGEDLLDAMALVDPAYIAAADEAPPARKRRWKMWAGVAACLCLLAAGVLGIWYAGSGGMVPAGDAVDADAAAEGSDSLPGGIRPALLVDGTLFYWTGPAMTIVGADTPGIMVSTTATGDTCLPEGYGPYGDIASVTAGPAAADGEIDFSCTLHSAALCNVQIAAAVGEDRETLEDVVEPYLIQQGFLQRTPRGRMATAVAWQHFGLTPATANEPVLSDMLF